MTTETTKAKWEAIKANAPAGATGVIVAEFETDQSDMQTDYFATRTERTVFLGYRFTAKESFKALRKAAATFAETAHMGPGCDVYTARIILADDVISNGSAYYKGQPSHWHQEIDGGRFERKTFTTRAAAEAFIASAPVAHPIYFGEQLVAFAWEITRESVEHRENYSMGAGNYLKASHGYSTGWTVSSSSFCQHGEVEILGVPKGTVVPVSVKVICENKLAMSPAAKAWATRKANAAKVSA